MTSANEPAPWSLDTNIVSYIVREDSQWSEQYTRVITNRLLALTYFGRAELEAAEWSDIQRVKLTEFIESCVYLGPPSDATRRWFARIARVRARLQLERRVAREDAWLIAQTAEYQLPLLSHDRNAVRVARAIGLDVSGTLLDVSQLERLFQQDERILTNDPLPRLDF